MIIGIKGPKTPTNLIIMIQTLDVFLKIVSVIFFDEITMYIYAECQILKLNTNSTTLISKTMFPDYFIFSLCNRYYVKGKFQIFGEILPYLKLGFYLGGVDLPSNGKFSEVVWYNEKLFN